MSRRVSPPPVINRSTRSTLNLRDAQNTRLPSVPLEYQKNSSSSAILPSRMSHHDGQTNLFVSDHHPNAFATPNHPTIIQNLFGLNANGEVPIVNQSDRSQGIDLTDLCPGDIGFYSNQPQPRSNKNIITNPSSNHEPHMPPFNNDRDQIHGNEDWANDVDADENERQDKIAKGLSDLNTLWRKAQSSVTFLSTHSKQPLTFGQVELELSTLNKMLEKHSDVEEFLLRWVSLRESADVESRLQTTERLIKSGNVMARDILRTFQSKPNPISLPKLQLPQFSGNAEDWASFSELFDQSIHNRQDLAPIEKFRYLKSLMSPTPEGPLKIINHLELTASNYDAARKLLVDRFADQRSTVHLLIEKILFLPCQKEESKEGLNDIVDTTRTTLRALNSLKIPTEQWDPIVLVHFLNRIDKTTKKEWEMSLRDTKVQPLNPFLEFLEAKARALPSFQRSSSYSYTNNHTVTNQTNLGYPQNHPRNSTNLTGNRISSNHTRPFNSACHLCGQNGHPNFRCPILLEKTPSQRKTFIREKGACDNCLLKSNPPHRAEECQKRGCYKCEKKHHSLLHRPIDDVQSFTTTNAITTSESTPGPVSTNSPKVDTSDASISSFLNSESTPSQGALLATAVVNVPTTRGFDQPVRALIDQGSQVNFISDRIVQVLGLSRQSSRIPIRGVTGSSCGQTMGTTTLIIQSRTDKNYQRSVMCHIVPKVTVNLPHRTHNPEEWIHLSQLKLADESFHMPAAVDLLLGAEVFTDILLPGKEKGPPGTPTAIKTTLGWILMGSTSKEPEPIVSNVGNLDFDLQNFWKQEMMPNDTIPNENPCEAHFAKTHQRGPDGRFIVRLAFKPNPPQLGDSKKQALSRLFGVERRLQRHSEYQKPYHDSFRDLISKGHMIKVPDCDLSKPKEEIFYLPHHFVLKPTSTTTKLRVVLDGSAKSTTQVSLNDILLTGPTIQPELVNTLTRFRLHRYAMMADVQSMYHQIRVHEDHQDFLRILWRETPIDPIVEYRLTVVPFGISIASFLAIRSMFQLAKDEEKDFPLAAKTIHKNSYVDDFLPSSPTLGEGIQLQSSLIQLTDKGGFHIRKWSANEPRLLENIPPEDRETSLDKLQLGEADLIKALGIMWDPSKDEFSFKIKLQQFDKEKTTKRSIFSHVASLFDPLGFLQPVTVNFKILIQEIWKSDVKWDDLIPIELESKWKLLLSQMVSLESIRIPRWVTTTQYVIRELHGFADASSKAKGAVVYLRTVSNSGITSRIIMSKSQVAPVSPVTIPRLELESALLLTRLMKVVLASFEDDEIPSQFYWTDSSIVLYWIHDESPNDLDTFVRNRIEKIRLHSSPQQWFHVRTLENPADIISRGIPPNNLESHHLWWGGPPWLQTNELPYGPIPGSAPKPPTKIQKEESPTISCYQTILTDSTAIISRFSSFSRLKRVTAWIFRFISNARNGSRSASEGIPHPLTCDELSTAEKYWIKRVQAESFNSEIKCIESKNPLHSKSKLLPLHPELDRNGLLQVTGRLQRSQLSSRRKHPLILPGQHPLTRLLLQDEHQKTLHGGRQLILSRVWGKYWILNASRAVRSIIRQCVTCARFSADPANQLMGNLPECRVVTSRAFENTGVDFGGPFTLRTLKSRIPRRKPKAQTYFKGYLCLFICMATKAVHIEAVSDLTPAGFLAALRRFIARRGKPIKILSDNGTNFTASAKELTLLEKIATQEQIKSITSNPVISDELSNQGIAWSFNPPASPHHGGLWEAAIKSTKHHLRRVMGDTLLDFEEFTTLLAQIEGILNSRPITPMTTDPDDMEPLTPGHFLIGRPVDSAPDADLSHLPENRLSRWQIVQS